MGCYVAKCKLCKKEIKADGHLGMLFNEAEHEKIEHLEVFEKNKKAKEEFHREYKKINDKLIYSEQHIFTETKWVADDMTDEEISKMGA